MLLRQLELTHSSARALPPVKVDTLLSGLTGAMLGFVCTLVGGALGSAFAHEMVGALAAWLIFSLGGCAYARYEHQRGEHALAEFVLSATQAGALTGLLTFVSLASQSLMLLPIAFLSGMLLPTLVIISQPEH
ncbi:MAG: hypothetical protein KF760_26075 [Candidatus Eremiobacteraeota bacterium]|nr:hypothetical protein [Candidatus Eremiobacteraeota bacterium]MCW5869670.1 hypothetical protein [Candidatus Eremiobacteraeota bacterium]